MAGVLQYDDRVLGMKTRFAREEFLTARVGRQDDAAAVRGIVSERFVSFDEKFHVGVVPRLNRELVENRLRKAREVR